MKRLISVDEARQLLTRSVKVVEAEQVDLARAHGRVLHETVVADRDFPSTDRSAMDGFAVAVADLTGGEATLRVDGEVRAGAPVGDLRAGAGAAVRIFTGGVIPPGADAVVMVEDTREDRQAGRVTIRARVREGQHIRRRAQDRRAGEPVLRPGVLLHAPEVATLASVGRTRVDVHRLPVVHVLSTGDEIVEPDRRPAEHQVRNSNGLALLAQLREVGVCGRYLGIAPDREDDLAAALRKGLEGDLLLVTGGVSVGEYDLVGRALGHAGMDLLFHGVAVKPGKPILAGRCGRCLVVGLPGNPVSTYAGFAVFVAPALRRMMGLARWEACEVPVRLAEQLVQRPGRRSYRLVRVEADGAELVARPIATTGSGDVLSLVRANAFVIVPEDADELPVGTRLTALLWNEFQLR